MIARDVLLVFAGGSIGTAVRYSLGAVFPSDAGLQVTLVINVTGALLLGVLTGWVGSRTDRPAHDLLTFLGTGALGGYTTYGMFAVDTDGLLDTARFGDGILYGAATVLLGVAAALGGLVIGARLAGRRSAR